MKNNISKLLNCLIVALLCMLTSAAMATAVIAPFPSEGGPDSFGYTYTDSHSPLGPTYEWIEISGTGTQPLELDGTDDHVARDISLGFFFNYYGSDYSSVHIGNNGIVFSSGSSGQWVNEPIGQSEEIHGFLAPYWDDIVTWNGGAVYYEMLGVAPNRIFVVEWVNNQHYHTSPKGITFEAVLYEGSNDILFQYKDLDFGDPEVNNGNSATVGIEGPTGNIGLQYSYNQPVVDPGLAIRFKYPQYQGVNLFLSSQAPPSKDRGTEMTLQLFYHSFGDADAQNVVLKNTLPNGVDFVSASGVGVYDPVSRTVSWSLGPLPSRTQGAQEVVVSIPADAAIGTTITSSSRIQTTDLEVRYDDNEAQTETRVTGSSLPAGTTVEPNNGGTTPSVYWGTPVTFSYTSSATAIGVDIRIHIADGEPDITGPMEGGPPTWTFTTTFYPRHGQATVTYTVHEATSDNNVIFDIYIDPAGYIYDQSTGARIAGATVWLQSPDGLGGWQNVPTGQDPAISQPDENPLVTGFDGQYQWNVLAGSYRVHVEAPGYYPADSIVVSIPPAVTDLHVGLVRMPDLRSVSYPLVSYRRITRTLWEYTYRFNIKNVGIGNATAVSASLEHTPAQVTIVDGIVFFPAVPPGGATVASTDTFTIRIDRSAPVQNFDLTWRLSFTDAAGTARTVVNYPLY